ncbi:MAG: hypothetical protein ABI884_04990 [Gemmatimonadota bacterium]
MSMFAILIAASSLWIVYGALNRDWPVILTNGGMVALNVALAVAKVRFSEKVSVDGSRNTSVNNL